MRGALAPSAFVVSFSHHIMLALTMDRYIFIEHPLHYPMIITPGRTWFIVLLAFLGAVANSMICALAFQVKLINILESHVGGMGGVREAWMKCKIRLKLSQLGCSWQLLGRS